MGYGLAEVIRSNLLSLEGVSRVEGTRKLPAIYAEGSPAGCFYFLDSGLVKIYRRGPGGKEIILRLAAGGELFGEDAFLEDASRGASADAIGDAAMFLIPRGLFLAHFEKRPELSRLLPAMMAVRQRELERKLECLFTHDVEWRMLRCLADLAAQLSRRPGGEHEIPLSQGELASLIGATRETTSTLLNVLARRGLLRLGRRLLTVPSIEKLRAAEAPAQAASAAPGSR